LREAIRCKPNDPLAHFGLGIALRDKGRLDDAIVEYRAAIGLQKKFPGLVFDLPIAPWQSPAPNWPATPHLDLGLALWQKGRFDEAFAEYREAIRIKPDYAEAHNALGTALRDTRKADNAMAEYREAIRLRPDFAEAHYNLGCALSDKGRTDEAITEYREAIRLKPDYAEAHCNLGIALRDRGQLDDAIAEYRQAIRHKKDLATAHINLAEALWQQHRPDEAIAEYREALRIDPGHAEVHGKLGVVLRGTGRLDEAIVELREAIRLRPDTAATHYNLGSILTAQRLHDEAIAEYLQAIRLRPDYAEAHCNLGHSLMQQGRFREALEHMRRGHDLGSKNPGWRYPSAQWVQLCQRLVEVDDRLTGILEGKATPAGPGERVDLGDLCCFKHLNRTGVRFYEEAFTVAPSLADNPGNHRYHAACAAAQAGCGQGKDSEKLPDGEYVRLRRQALIWLRGDMIAWSQLLDKATDQADSAGRARKALQQCLTDAAFAGVRGPAAVASLPEAERRPWQELWDDVASVLARIQGVRAPQR
jgi:tetratricopeptide (TPR) repeat protein